MTCSGFEPRPDCHLFYDDFSVTWPYIVGNRTISEWRWIGKDLLGSGRGPIFKVLSLHSIGGNEENHDKPVRLAGRGSRKSNPEHPEYEVGVLTTGSRRLVVPSEWLLCNPVEHIEVSYPCLISSYHTVYCALTDYEPVEGVIVYNLSKNIVIDCSNIHKGMYGMGW
jgi:hypothetical protein